MNVFSKLLCRRLIVPWTQPRLTSNGTFGGNQMAVSRTFGGNNGAWGEAYTAFSPNTGIVGFYCDEWKSSMYFNVYYPNPIKANRITFYIPSRSAPASGAYNIHIWGGNYNNDRSQWVQQLGDVGENSSCNAQLNCPNYYQYYTLYFENGGWSYEDSVEIQSITLYGEYEDFI